MSQAPRPISAHELVHQVQRYPSDPREARDIVRPHIYHLRQKLKAASGQTDVIATVRGVGYKLKG